MKNLTEKYLNEEKDEKWKEKMLRLIRGHANNYMWDLEEIIKEAEEGKDLKKIKKMIHNVVRELSFIEKKL